MLLAQANIVQVLKELNNLRRINLIHLGEKENGMRLCVLCHRFLDDRESAAWVSYHPISNSSLTSRSPTPTVDQAKVSPVGDFQPTGARLSKRISAMGEIYITPMCCENTAAREMTGCQVEVYTCHMPRPGMGTL